MVDIENLSKLGTIKKYKADEYIFHEGEPGNEMYIVLSGKMNVYINSTNGLPILISEIGPSNFFGEMSLLENQPRSASVIAASNTVALIINKDNFQSFICNNPSMAYKLMKGLSSRIRSLNNEVKTLTDHLKLSKFSGSPGITEKNDNFSNDINADCKLPEYNEFNLLPDGHKTYSMTVPSVYKEYVYSKQINCPICDKSFYEKMQRLPKLVLVKEDFDFRKRYVDFDPLWYTIWVCPHCYYANLQLEFNLISDSTIKTLREKNSVLKEKFPFEFTEPLDINQVFFSYYLALFSAKTYCKDPLKFAKLWLHLTWLYKDVGDQEMAALASTSALEYYLEAFNNPKQNSTLEQEQQMNLILGELYLMKGKKSEALKHFTSAFKNNRSNQTLSRQAKLRIDEIENSQVIRVRM